LKLKLDDNLRKPLAGLGKTIQTLAHIEHEREAAARSPVLLICPTSVIGNWQHEAARFTPGLWSLMEFLNPGLLGTQGRVQAEFLRPNPGLARPGSGGAPEEADSALHPAPPQDRQGGYCGPARKARDEGPLHADQGAGLALCRRA
jgi:SNF2-related domain